MNSDLTISGRRSSRVRRAGDAPVAPTTSVDPLVDPIPGAASLPATYAILLIAAFIAAFWINLDRLWRWTNPGSGDPNWGHAIFIPLISLAYLLDRREQFRRIPARAWPAGLVLVAAGLALFVGGIALGVNFAQFGPYLQDLGMLATLVGCVVSVFGPRVSRAALFPMAYLACALPWPPVVHDTLTRPLQHLAATASVHVLQWTGMNVEQAGNTIHILNAAGGAGRTLNVAEACSGMRSLITFVAIGLAVAFMSARPLWQKIIISLSAVPIAIACNVFRIAGEGLLDQWVSRRLSEGFAHSAVGLVLLIPGFGLFLLVGWILDRIIVRDVPRQTPREAPRTAGAPNRGLTPRRMSLVVSLILLTSGGALAATSHVMQLHFRKLPVPLRQPLAALPAELWPWRQFGGDRQIPDDIRQTLGTPDYLFRDYIDARAAGPEAVAAIRSDPSGGRAMFDELAAAHPDAVVRLALTYYTGHVDAVIHQAERCNLAAGVATAIDSERDTWQVGGRPLAVRIVRLISDQDSQSQVAAGHSGRPRYVAYCYRVNGHEETEAWRVRGRLMNVFDRSAWYAKIEVTTDLEDRGACERVLSDFLTHALPQIDRCLPPMDSDPKKSGS